MLGQANIWHKREGYKEETYLTTEQPRIGISVSNQSSSQTHTEIIAWKCVEIENNNAKNGLMKEGSTLRDLIEHFSQGQLAV